MTGEPSAILGALSPGLILILGGLLVAVLPRVLRSVLVLALPVLAFVQLLGLEPGSWGTFTIFDYTLVTLRLDGLSLPFVSIFLLALFIAGIYQLADATRLQQAASLIYAGSSVGAVLAGDLVTLFLFWEGTAISSVFLIWGRGTERALAAGNRYIVAQVASGVLLLAGAMIHYGQTGSTEFDSFDPGSTAGLLLFISFGIKAAFPLLHSWLKDAYPEATISGTVILSIFTTKLAIYALARGFAGTEVLVPIGAAMAVFPILWAVIETDYRRVLAWALNSQLGFMVVGIGIGTELAVNGAVAHALCSVIYQALLFMGIGAVLFRTGTARGADLGGLARQMPLTATFYLIGAASIAAFPLFSGFVSKSLILSAAGYKDLLLPWMALLFASAGAFLISGLRIPYNAFWGGDAGLRVQEAPVSMLVAMGLAAALCIGIGVFPGPLYAIMPYPVEYHAYTAEHVLTQFQLLFFTALLFVALMRFGLFPLEERSTDLEFDWAWRRVGFDALRGLGWAARLSWDLLSQAVRDVSGDLVRLLSAQYGPTGTLARTWPSGSMTIWMTLMLLAFLAFSFF